MRLEPPLSFLRQNQRMRLSLWYQTRLKASKQTFNLVKPKESSPREVHLEKHDHTHFAFGDDIPKPVLEFIVENQGRWPSEAEFKRLVK